MIGLITGIILFISVLLILIVLVQNPKGGGLSSSFSSSNQFMGVKRTADFIEKATWGFAAGLLFLSVISTIIVSSKGSANKSNIEINNQAPTPDRLPSYPTTPSGQQQTPQNNQQQNPQ